MGQIDTFSAASTLGWANGPNGVAPVVISTGGPAGVGDGYLQAAPTLTGDFVVAQLGVDNIKDLATVPEPSALLLLTAGLVALGMFQRLFSQRSMR